MACAPQILLPLKIDSRVPEIHPTAITYDSFEASWMKGLTVCIVAGSLSLNLVGMLTQCEVIVLCSYFKGNAWNVAQPSSISKFASGEFRLFENLY